MKNTTLFLSYRKTLTPSRLRCTRNIELHSKAFSIANPSNEQTDSGSNDLTTQK